MSKLYCSNSLFIVSILFSLNTSACSGDSLKNKINTAIEIIPDTANAGLKLPAGFSAVKFADGLGAARHLAVTNNGGVYVKLERLKDGKGIYYLYDSDADGKADIINGFGKYIGTGICIKNDFLYASSNEEVFRYQLNNKGEVLIRTLQKKLLLDY